MKKNLFYVTIMLMLIVSSVFAQTKTVSKSGTPDFATVQAAIDFFNTDPDAGTPNIINITDSSVYDEMITITAPVTIQGTGSSRPVLAVQMNSNGDTATNGQDGLLIKIATGTSNNVTLKNLIVIPSKTSTPPDDGIRSHGQNLNITLENVLVTANNGSNAPVSTTGLSAVSLTGATQFGDDGIFIGGDTTITGSGVTATFKNVVATHIQGALAATSNDGLVLSGSTNVFRIQDGCVFSYCNRIGIQAAGDFQLSAPTNRVIVKGNKGFAGIWFAAAPGAAVTNPRTVDGCNIVDNSGSNNTVAPVGAWGVEIQNGGTVNWILRNSIISGNTDRGLVIGTLAGSGTITIENVTIAKNGTSALEVVTGTPAYAGNITATNCIFAGNGSTASSNVIIHNGTGTFGISYSGIVTAGTEAFLSSPTTGTGPYSLSNIVNADPLFLSSTDHTSASFFDVGSSAYAAASSTSGNLGGGADYAGGTTPAAANNNWVKYH